MIPTREKNWIRAGKARTPERSKFTSVYDRIQGRKARQRLREARAARFDGWLSPVNFAGDGQFSEPGQRASDKGMLSMTLQQYLKIVDWTGRQLRGDKPGAIPRDLPPILERLGLDCEGWLECLQEFPEWFTTAVGSATNLKDFARQLGQKWVQGLGRLAAVLQT